MLVFNIVSAVKYFFHIQLILFNFLKDEKLQYGFQ